MRVRRPWGPDAAMSIEFAALWDEAIQKYKSETGHDPPRNLGSPNITVDAILAEVEKSSKDFASYRSKQARLRDALQPLCFTLQSLAEATGHFTKLAFPPGEGICSALVVLLKAAKGVSNKYNAIAEMLEDLDGIVWRAKIYPVHEAMKKTLVENLAHVLVVLGTATKAIREGRVGSFFKNLIGKDGKVKDMLFRMGRLSIREDLTVGAVTLSTTNTVLGCLHEGMRNRQTENEVLRNMVARIARGAEAIFDSSHENRAKLEDIRKCLSSTSDSIRDQRYSNIISWIDAPNVSTAHEDACEKKAPGTGAWLLNNERYLRWKSGEADRMLWLNGGPGCGKSILSSTVIEDIRFTQITEPSTSIAYFYFDFRDPEKQMCRSLVASLVDQLAFSSLEARSAVEALYSELSLRKKHLTWRNLAEILQSLCKVTGPTHIIVDALDECTEWDNLAEFLKMIHDFRTSSPRILCSSRNEIKIQDVLKTISTSIDLKNSIVDSDISTYVDLTLRINTRFRKWNDREKNDIKTTLKSQANGMFRWVYCQLETLSRCIKPKALRKALQTLPASLYETYDRILLQVDSEHYEDVVRILEWLLCAYRPMELKEIAEILAIDFDSDPPKFVPEDRLPDPRDVASICGSLVTLNASGILELAHFSVKEYLMSGLGNLAARTDLKSHEMSKLARYSIDERLAHTSIARSCLVYLLHLKEPVHYKTPDLFPLAIYAAEYWVRHSRQSDSSSLYDLELSFFCLYPEDQQFFNWIRLYDLDAEYDRHRTDLNKDSRRIPTRLYYAARVGLMDVVMALLIKNEDVNVQSGRYGSPLQAASLEGHESIIQLLLNSGADVNMGGGEYGSALQAAAYRNHETVVRLLLESGANVNMGGGFYGSALQAATSHGNEKLLKLLLENGADVNQGGGHFGVALHAAANSGFEAVVKLLLENGADVNMSGGYYGSALQAAALGGHEALVRLLLNDGADINMSGREFGSAVQAAAFGGHETVVKLLLENGAHINKVRDSRFGSALIAAASAFFRNDNGNEKVVKMLLDNGADVNIIQSGGMYGSALQAAAFGGHETVVKLLLENGADVNLGGEKFVGKYRTTLNAARMAKTFNKDDLEAAKEAIIKLLLEHGAIDHDGH